MSERSHQAIYLAASLAILTIHLLLRIPLLFIRAPFFDELFTVWISSKTTPGIIAALQQDSGPPLYYLIAHAVLRVATFGAAFIDAVTPLRFISLLASVGALILLLTARRLGEIRWVAALLLALLPSHVYFSTEARAYALCAFLVGAGVMALLAWAEDEKRPLLIVGCLCLVLGAYTHYYGVLFFPTPFVITLVRRRRVAEGFAAAAASGVLFLPGFLLAATQPPEAIAWLKATTPGGTEILGSILRQLGFAVPYPANFLSSPPLWLQMISFLITALVLASGTIRSERARILAVITLTPILSLFALDLARRTVYFPLRFESVLAIPFVVWFAVSLERWPLRARRAVLVAVLLIATYVSYAAILESARRPPDPFRAAAIFARERVPQSATIVATGPSYLETVAHRRANWMPNVLSWPAEQAEHPGWRPLPAAVTLERELRSLPSHFFWIGEFVSDEYRMLERSVRVEPRFVNGPLIVAEVSRR